MRTNFLGGKQNEKDFIIYLNYRFNGFTALRLQQ